MSKVIDERLSRPTALWWKNERDQVGAGRDDRVADFLNDAGVESVGCIFGSGFSKELPRAAAGDLCSLDNNVGNSNLIGQDKVK